MGWKIKDRFSSFLKAATAIYPMILIGENKS